MRLVPAVLFAACAAAGAASAAPTIGSCPLFPANHVLNARVDTLPVHPRSAAWVANVSSTGDGASRAFHMDFGSAILNGQPIGIPYVVVDGSQPKVPVSFTWADESDPGPYPIPPTAPVEPGDRHVLVVDGTQCVLYEMYNARTQNGGASWTADAGAVFGLASNALRPAGWTSADAAGLAILPSLARYDEVATGAIQHALRFTASQTQRAYVWPARHFASTVTNPDVAPMGARFRMKATVDTTRFTGEARIIAEAMKAYGIVLADNGSPWFVSGSPDARWNDTTLRQLASLTGNDFEAVDTSGLMVSPDSGEAAGGTTSPPPPPPPAPTTAVLGISRSGRGTVTSTDGLINCGSTCNATVPIGSAVTLVATPSTKPSSVFKGWSGGGCTGTGACTVTVNADLQVTATFARR